MLYSLFVYTKTSPIIESNKMASTGDIVRIQVLPGMEGGFEQQGEGTEFPYWIGYTDVAKKMPGGYIFITRGKGFSSTIETMVGVNNNGTITGVKILFQQETLYLEIKLKKFIRDRTLPGSPTSSLANPIQIILRLQKMAVL